MIFYWWCCVFNDIEPPGGKKLPEEIAGSRSDGCGVTDKRAPPPPDRLGRAVVLWHRAATPSPGDERRKDGDHGSSRSNPGEDT